MGESMANFTFPVCSQFKPTILDGQLCFQLDLASVLEGKLDTRAGKENGLMVIVDINEERSVQVDVNKRERSDDRSLNLAVIQSDRSKYAKIYIHTLAQFAGHGPGSYAITALKKMTGTTQFLQMTDDKKHCQSEVFEECKNQRYLEEGRTECGGCVPWGLETGGAAEEQVSEAVSAGGG